MFPFLIVLLALSALTTITGFVLYIKTRLTPRDHPDTENPDPARMAELDRREGLYQRIHFLSLFLFVTVGVCILVLLSRRAA